MKFGNLIEYNVRDIFLQKSCRKRCFETSSRPFLFFKNTLHEVKASDQHLSVNIFWYSSTRKYNKNKMYKASCY